MPKAQTKRAPRPLTVDDIARRFLNTAPAPRPAATKKKVRKRTK